MFCFGSMIAEMQAAKAQKAVEMFNRRLHDEAVRDRLYSSWGANHPDLDLTPTNIPQVKKSPNKGLQ